MTIGRPRLDESEKRSETLALRLTPAEKTALEKQAQNAGMSVATYTRKLIQGTYRQSVSKTFNDAALLSELNRLGLELDHIATARLEGCDPQRLDALLVTFNETLLKVGRAYGS